MIKFLLSLTAPTRSRSAKPSTEVTLQWMRDPLSHPSLQAMGERELADLPFRR